MNKSLLILKSKKTQWGVSYKLTVFFFFCLSIACLLIYFLYLICFYSLFISSLLIALKEWVLQGLCGSQPSIRVVGKQF